MYFIAVVPDALIREEVTAFKEYARDHFQTKHALRSPPHITLIPPFWTSEAASLRKTLAEFTANFPCRDFRVLLDGFQAFPPRVIFVRVVPDSLLKALQKDLQRFLWTSMRLKARSKYEFHPHMTVAFKDLKRSRFPEAWAYFSQLTYVREFHVTGLALLRHSAGEGWTVAEVFPWADSDHIA